MTSESPHTLVAHRAQRFVVAVESRGRSYKLFQIQFQPRGGSIFVSFPYYRTTKGLASLVTWNPEDRPPTTLSLEPGGKATSHLVKYSHHPDGRVHFSQTGKVITAVKKQSVPLAKIEGHFFTVQLQGLHHFATVCSSDAAAPTAKRLLLKFNFATTPLPAVKFVGHLYPKAALSHRLVGNPTGPVIPFLSPSGKAGKAFVCSAPVGTLGEDTYLLLLAESIPVLDARSETALTFIGGFDPSEVVANLTSPTTFLALSYPLEDFAEMTRRLGTIDFRAG